jgi:hypothetical protein
LRISTPFFPLAACLGRILGEKYESGRKMGLEGIGRISDLSTISRTILEHVQTRGSDSRSGRILGYFAGESEKKRSKSIDWEGRLIA